MTKYSQIFMFIIFGLCAMSDCPEPLWLQGVRNEMDLASLGANRVLNVLYQRCDASKIVIGEDRVMEGYDNSLGDLLDGREMSEAGLPPETFYNREKVTAPGNHPYLADSYGPNCRDIRRTPPVFHMNGRAKIKENKNSYELDVFNSTWRDPGGSSHESQFIVYECSGLVSAGYAAGGLKFSTKGSTWEQTQITTSAMSAVGHPPKPTDCLEVAKFSSDSSIKNGDIIFFRMKSINEGHSAILDSVGPDPFALANINSSQECTPDYIDPNKFDFKLIVAGTASTRAAAIKTDGASFSKSDGWGPLLYEMAMTACRAKFKTQEASSEANISLYPSFSRILRHVGRKNMACFYTKPVNLVGESCVEKCKESSAK